MPTLTYASNRVRIEAPYDPQFVAALKKFVPMGYRNWNPHEKTWVVYIPYVAEVTRLVGTYFSDVKRVNVAAYEDAERETKERVEQQQREAHERAERRRNYSQDGFNYQYSGSGSYRNASQNVRNGPTSDENYRALYLTPDAPKEVVEAAYRALARLYHPDVNDKNTTEAMQKINVAVATIKRQKGWSPK